jgi:hypothetical protein
MSRRPADQPLLLRLEGGQVLELSPEEARLLVAALWNVAATTRGAVVAIGKIEHRLTERHDRPTELSAPETTALRMAVGEAAEATGELASLRAALA